MITKKELEQIENLYKEQDDLEKRIDKLESIPQKIVQDSVRSTSKHFPYTEHTTTIEGFEEDNTYKRRKKQLKKLKKIYLENKIKLDKSIIHLEYELKKIEEEDSDIRKIIRLKYEDNLSWIQIMFKMNYNAESTARMKLDRFLEEQK